MNPIEFQNKWLANTQKERTASQSHFNDLCELVNHPKPLELDPTGEFFTFERGASKLRGGQGWADVWYRNRFALEYKGPGKDLKVAYDQLAQYREDLENPPLLIVSDLDRIAVHTNFTGTVKRVHEIDLATITEPESLRVLRAAFFDPDSLKPSQTVQAVTEQASRQFSTLAGGLRERGADPREAAHFLMQLLFCLFAEDIGILKNAIFSRVVTFGAQYPARFNEQIEGLLSAMARGGFFNMEAIPHVNGGLFSRIVTFDLTGPELAILAESAKLDWSSIEPAIFGTLFERSLDPGKRAQLGAHYTGRRDIERVVDPVMMTPLRREWEGVRAEMDTHRATAEAATTPQTRRNAQAKLAASQSAFLQRLAEVRVLDPACGSGNFLYVALERLLALEKEAIRHGAEAGLTIRLPGVGPGQLLGMEIDPLARELAQVAIWIGYLQWMIGNGFGWKEPVLEPLETIRLQDALITTDDAGMVATLPSPIVSGDSFAPAAHATETRWPKAEFIIGNPPFLGSSRMRGELGSDYLKNLFAIYRGRVSGMEDLCCYFFEKARLQLIADHTKRAGLLATNSIRGGFNREALARMKRSGDIYMAWSDEEWTLNGASVRISIVGFDDGSEGEKRLNGLVVSEIHSDLSGSLNLPGALNLEENARIGFNGVKKGGPFEIEADMAREMLEEPLNPNNRPNSDVLRPFVSGADITGRPRDLWIVDFGIDMAAEDASLYESPYRHVLELVKPVRDKNRRPRRRDTWWLYSEVAPGLRRALGGKYRQIVLLVYPNTAFSPGMNAT